ncbi:hypothetical protein SDJN02_18910, partial [Cucurbita argyrosperma subsp. argyrosperma]
MRRRSSGGALGLSKKTTSSSLPFLFTAKAAGISSPNAPIIRYYWIPRLIQKINQSSSLPPPPLPPPPPPPSELPGTSQAEMVSQSSYGFEAPVTATPLQIGGDLMGSSCNSSSSSSSGFQNYENYGSFVNDYWDEEHGRGEMMNWATTAMTGDSGYPVAHCHMAETNWTHSDFTGYVPSMDELWQF